MHAQPKFTKPEYGKKVQYAYFDESKPINKKAKKRIKSEAGEFLYLGQAIDNTIFHALNKLSIGSSDATEEVQEAL